MSMRKVIRQLYRYLAADGWLIVSAAETSQELFSEFATVSLGDVTLYRKTIARLPAALALPYDEVPGLSEEGCYEAAGQMAVVLVSQNGRDAEAMFLLARNCANQGKLAEALAWCDKSIAVDKLAARAHYLRATILQEQNSITEALLALRHAVYAEPQFVLGHFALGNLTLKHGMPKESQKHFENVLLLLARYGPEDIVPESDGLSAGRLREIAVTLGTPKTSAHAGELIRAPKQVDKLELSGR
jgi:chemotaxis protein methyltransferase CheR